MKNIHVLPTDKPSRLVLDSINNNLFLTTTKSFPSDIMKFKNIYITSDEEIKVDDYFIESLGLPDSYLVHKLSKEWKDKESFYRRCTKVILTTDQELIKDGVQVIDDDFLNWFIKNPSCEWVWIKEKQHFEADKSKRKNPLNGVYYSYKIIIPEEEPNKTSYLDELPNMDKDVLLKMWESAIPKLKLKQETIEEAAANLADPSLCKTDNWIAGAKWAQERMYSDEEVLKAQQAILCNIKDALMNENYIIEYIEQLKNKQDGKF